MTERMSGDIKDLRRRIAKLVSVAILQFNIDPGNPFSVGTGTDNRAASLFFKFQITAGVIVMVMRIQNVRQRPALNVQCRQDRIDDRGFDRRQQVRGCLARQPDVIVNCPAAPERGGSRASPCFFSAVRDNVAIYVLLISRKSL